MHSRITHLIAFGFTVVLVSLAAPEPTPASPASSRHPLWAVRFRGPDTNDIVGGMALHPDGSLVYVSGYNDIGGRLIAYDASTGAPVWLARGEKGSSYGQVGVSPDGSRVYVSGTRYSSQRSYDFLTVAYDSRTGARLWRAGYKGQGGTTDQKAGWLAISPDGSRVFVFGISCCVGLQDYVTVAYDATSGAGLWASRYDSGNGNDFPSAIAMNPDGTAVYVTGWSQSPHGGNNVDFATVAIDPATGHQMWVRRFDGGMADVPRDMAVTPDGTRLVVTGSTETSLGDDYATITYSASGEQLWVARYDGPFTGFDSDIPYAVTVSPDGSTAFVSGQGNTDETTVGWGTVAYDVSTGTERWVARMDDGDRGVSNVPHDAAVSSDGRFVFVAGAAEFSSSRHLDYVTICYDAATGTHLGRAVFKSPGDDQAYHVALASDGTKVFVTGSNNPDPGPFSFDANFLTLAYNETALAGS